MAAELDLDYMHDEVANLELDEEEGGKKELEPLPDLGFGFFQHLADPADQRCRQLKETGNASKRIYPESRSEDPTSCVDNAHNRTISMLSVQKDQPAL